MYLAAWAEHLPKGKTLELFVPSFTLLKEQITHSHHCQGSVVFNTVHLSIALKGWSSWYIPGDGLMVRELPYLTQYIPPLGSLIWVFRFCLQDIWLKSQYKIEIVIWMLVGAQGPIMQGFSGLLAGWIKDLAGSLKNLNFTKFIQIQCFEGWHENIHLPYTHISPLGNHLVWVKISNLPTFPPGKFSTCRPGGWVEKNWEIIGLQNIHMGTACVLMGILVDNFVTFHKFFEYNKSKKCIWCIFQISLNICIRKENLSLSSTQEGGKFPQQRGRVSAHPTSLPPHLQNVLLRNPKKCSITFWKSKNLPLIFLLVSHKNVPLRNPKKVLNNSLTDRDNSWKVWNIL